MISLDLASFEKVNPISIQPLYPFQIKFSSHRRATNLIQSKNPPNGSLNRPPTRRKITSCGLCSNKPIGTWFRSEEDSSEGRRLALSMRGIDG